MSGGDKIFERKLIDIIKEEFPKEKEVYFNNINAKNLKLTSEIVTFIKYYFVIISKQTYIQYVLATLNFDERLIK